MEIFLIKNKNKKGLMPWEKTHSKTYSELFYFLCPSFALENGRENMDWL